MLGETDPLLLLRTDADRVEAYLRGVLANQRQAPARLLEAIEYSLMAGGKRLRPTLVLEAARCCSGNADVSATTLAAAGAIELIHTFSLVHDDLPAMDDDDLRRGRPTNHKVFGEPMAILAGDAMVSLAFQTLAGIADPAAGPAVARELSAASGPQGMIGGQVLDMEGENKSLSLQELQQVHRRKTGALITAACRMGAISVSAGADALASMTEYGEHLGIAFQIVDDVLDVTSTPEQLGKATNKDAGRGKNTYPALMGLDASRKAAAEHLDAAIAALEPFGASAGPLRVLARFVVERTH
jgi:geranylgeranyl diphosphate synthase type II